MVENTRSLDITAGVILALGMAFVLLPLVVALVTATQSYETVLTGGLGWLPGDRMAQNIGRVFTETPLPGQLWNSFVVASLVAGLKCALAFVTALAIVFFRIRWGGRPVRLHPSDDHAAGRPAGHHHLPGRGGRGHAGQRGGRGPAAGTTAAAQRP
jgi:ABC-type glycerol-3-phosphate transport system permease component